MPVRTQRRLCRPTACAYTLVLLVFEICDGVLAHGTVNLNLLRNLRSESDSKARDVKLCSLDEYYDANVDACSRCSEICRPNNPDATTLCVNTCRDYFARHFSPSLKSRSLQFTTLFTAINLPREGGNVDESVIEKPLFWTSVVSMTIASAATVAIIILCVRRKKLLRSEYVMSSRSMQREAADDSRSQRSRHLSETDGEPETKQLLTSEYSGEGQTDGRRIWNCSKKVEADKTIDWSANCDIMMVNGGSPTEKYDTGYNCRPREIETPSTPEQRSAVDRDHRIPINISALYSFEAEISKEGSSISVPSTCRTKSSLLLSSNTETDRNSCVHIKDTTESDYDEETNPKQMTTEKHVQYNCNPLQLKDIGVRTLKGSIIASAAETQKMKIDLRRLNEKEENGAEEDEELISDFGIYSIAGNELDILPLR